MHHRIPILTLAATLLLSAAAAHSADPIPWDPLADLAHPERLADPLPGRTLQASSADPTGGNDDFSHFVRTNPDGSRVMADLEGPGAVTRIWITAPPGTLDDTRLRIHVDGNTPIDMPITQFFAGETYPFLAPLVGDREASSGGYYCYVPLAFQERFVMEVVGFDEERFYYNINWRKLPAGSRVVPFRLPLEAPSQQTLHEAAEHWGDSVVGFGTGNDPITFKGSLPAGRSREIGALTTPSVIGALSFIIPELAPEHRRGLRLRIFWDGSDTPAVDAPLALLAAQGRMPVATLFQGTSDGDSRMNIFAFTWPMPCKEARIELLNNTESPVDDVRGSIYTTSDGTAPSPLRFHARYRSETPTRGWDNYTFLHREGRGHYVGTVLAGENTAGEFAWLEGDPMFYVDGETEPSLLGTGTEDYFNGGWYFENGPFVTPLHGAPAVDRDSAETVMFRHHFLDAVPFRTSIRATIEHGANNTFRGDYHSVALWYEEPGGRDLPVTEVDTAPGDAPLPSPGTNLLRNPGAEEFLTGWMTGGTPHNMPTLDPWTHTPDPDNHGGNHRFGISIGYNTVDCYQYQTVRVRPGKPHRASFHATHEDGTDEQVALTWIDGPWPGEETVLLETPGGPVSEWTHYEGEPFIPTTDTVTLVVRYRHSIPSGVASIHLDDIALVEVAEQ